MKEITITGGGLAGLSLGIALRQKEVPVTIHEAGTYPRHRVCGEFITGVAPSTLESLGIANCLSSALFLSNTSWYSCGSHVFQRRLPRKAWGISRWRLDDLLARSFVDLGGTLVPRKRDKRPAEKIPGRVWSAGRKISKGRHKWIGLKIHLHGSRLEDDLELDLGKSGYAGISRIEDGKLNLCGLFSLDSGLDGKGSDLLHAYLVRNNLSRMLRHLETGHADEDSFCAVAGLEYGLLQRTSEGFSLGDSWALIPPFTGNGMSMAFESAGLAVAPLAAWSSGETSWDACESDYRSAVRRVLAPRVRRARLLHAFLLLPQSRIMLAWLARNEVLPFRMLYGLTH